MVRVLSGLQVIEAQISSGLCKCSGHMAVSLSLQVSMACATPGFLSNVLPVLYPFPVWGLGKDRGLGRAVHLSTEQSQRFVLRGKSQGAEASR